MGRASKCVHLDIWLNKYTNDTVLSFFCNMHSVFPLTNQLTKKLKSEIDQIPHMAGKM